MFGLSTVVTVGVWSTRIPETGTADADELAFIADVELAAADAPELLRDDEEDTSELTPDDGGTPLVEPELDEDPALEDGGCALLGPIALDVEDAPLACADVDEDTAATSELDDDTGGRASSTHFCATH